MTPEELVRQIVHGQPEELAKALETLPEAERRKLSGTTAALEKAWRSGWDDTFVYRKFAKEVSRYLGRSPSEKDLAHGLARQNLALAILGAGTLGQVKHLDVTTINRPHNTFDALCLKVIRDRRPSWLSAWVDHQLSAWWHRVFNWAVLRDLIRDGVCPKPSCDGYIELLADSAWGPQRGHKDKASSLPELLLVEPDVLAEDIWRLFEVETSAFSGWRVGRCDPRLDINQWPVALARLADDGHLDRQRLLDESLRALTRDFKRDTLSGLCRFHRLLQPTADESRARESIHLGLLSHGNSFIVTFALDMLTDLERQGSLDGRAFLQAAAAVFAQPTKGPAMKCLKMAERIAKRDPSLRAAAISLAIEALSHGAAEVQERSMKLLSKWQEAVQRDHKDLLRARGEHISPSARAEMRAIFGEPEVRPPPHARSAQVPGRDELRQRIESLPEKERRLVGLDDINGVLDRPLMPAPLAFAATEVPILHAIDPVEPIDSVDDLIDAAAQAVETLDSAEELERILGAISRLCNRRPANFEPRTAALVKRIYEHEAHRGLVVPGPCGMTSGNLLGLWLRDRYRPPKYWEFDPLPTVKFGKSASDRDFLLPYHLLNAPFAFTQYRLEELRQRVGKRIEAPLLAEPTHRGGWIDPQVFVERLLQSQRAKVPFLRSDFIQGLLRLAPDGRGNVREAARSVAGIWGACLGWVLGDGGPPSRAKTNDLDIWIAAGRALAPQGDLSSAFPGLPGGIPDLVEPAAYRWRAGVRMKDGRRSRRDIQGVVIDPMPGPDDSGFRACFPETAEWVRQSRWQLTPAQNSFFLARCKDMAAVFNERRKLTQRTFQRLPTAAMHFFATGDLKAGSTDRSYDLCRAWSIEMLAMVWPLNPDSALALGASAIGCRIDKDPVLHAPDHAFLQPLFDRSRPWSEMAVLALCLALNAKDGDCQVTGIDALTEALDDGRAHPTGLAKVLAALARVSFLRANRLAAALIQVAQLSRNHKMAVAIILQEFFDRLADLPKDAHHLLQLLLDLMVELEQGLDDSTRRRLAEVKGTSKSAKLARRLCALETAPDSTVIWEAQARAVESRLRLAEGWLAAR